MDRQSYSEQRNDQRRRTPVSSEILDRQPPCDLGAEKAVLGSLILDGRRLNEVAPILRPEDFYSAAHRTLYGHLLGMSNGDGAVIDDKLLLSRLKEHGDLEAVGGVGHLAEIVQSVAVAAHAKHYAEVVREHAVRRRIIQTALEVVQDGYSGQGSAAELAGRARSRFEGETDNAAKAIFPVRTCAELANENFDARFYVERLLVELQPLVIGGPMKSMKTSLLVTLCYAIATGTPFLGHFEVKQAARVGLLSAESGLAAIRDVLIRIGRAVDLWSCPKCLPLSGVK